MDGHVRGWEVKMSIDVNGQTRSHDVAPWMLLVEYLRETVGLTGTKVGCETSACGACTVLLDGAPIKSCTMLAVQARGSAVHTIEGLASTDAFSGFAASMESEHGVQCGYCTPGIVASALALLAHVPEPSDADIVNAFDGNLCRCTGYVGILRAVRRALAIAAGESPDPIAGTSLAEPLVVTQVATGGVRGVDVEVV